MCDVKGHKPVVRISRLGSEVFNSHKNLKAEEQEGPQSQPALLCALGCMFPEQVFFSSSQQGITRVRRGPAGDLGGGQKGCQT